MYELLFEKQDSLALKTWRSYADEAGVQDLDAFDLCMESHTVDARIEADRAAAHVAGALGTPTVLVNGLRLGGVPSRKDLDDAISTALGNPSR